MKLLKYITVIIPAVFFSTLSISYADICFFGYTVNNPDIINEMYSEYGLKPNVGAVHGKDPTVVMQNAKASNDNGAKAIILLGDLIFNKVHIAKQIVVTMGMWLEKGMRLVCF